MTVDRDEQILVCSATHDALGRKRGIAGVDRLEEEVGEQRHFPERRHQRTIGRDQAGNLRGG
jgi:hypothetical protein